MNKREGEAEKVSDKKPAGKDAQEAQEFMKDLVKKAQDANVYQKNTEERPTGPATDNFGRVEIHDDEKVIVKGAPSGKGKDTAAAGTKDAAAKDKEVPAGKEKETAAEKPGKNPEQMTAAERAGAHITEYKDKATGVSYKFDEKGRPAEISKDGGVVKLAYEGNNEQPKSFSITDKNGKEIARGQDNLTVDLRTGEIHQTVKLNKAETGGVAQVDTGYSADGAMNVTARNEAGLKLQETQARANGDDPEILSTKSFKYLTSEGKPAPSADKIGAVMTQVVDGQGRLTDRVMYGSRADAEADKPSAREHVSYSEDPSKKTVTEKHETYSLAGGDTKTPALTVEKTFHTDTGATELVQKALGGNSEKITFDKNGNAIGFERTEGPDRFTATIKDGKVESVQKNGQELPAELQDKAKNFVQAEIAHTQAVQAEAQRQSDAGDRRQSDQPTQVTGPTGDLLHREGNVLQHLKVENGQVKDKDGKVVGQIDDKGDGTLNGKPFSTSKWSEGESSSFTGVGSDNARLGITHPDLQNKMQGVIKGPDGKDMYDVLNGWLYDQQGKQIAYLNADGKVEFTDKKTPPTDFNSFLPTGSKFEGVEYGKERTFLVNPDAANGRLFLVDEKSGKPVEYEVKMGMILDKATHEQVGILKTPAANASGGLEGGSILLTNSNPPGQERPLRDFTRAVFDLHLMGQRRDIEVRGVALGPQSGTDAGAGGLVNIDHLRNLNDQSYKAAEDRHTEWFSRSYVSRHFTTSTSNDAENDRLKSFTEWHNNATRELDLILQTGDCHNAQRLGVRESTEKPATIEDPLIREKQRLDTARRKLEDLPSDTSTLNGTVNLADLSKNPPGHRTFQIRAGEIIGEDGKPVGKILDKEGHISFQGQKVGMKDLAGSVWHLEYPNSTGATQKVDWVSLGTNGGVVSMGDLKRRAAAEVTFAEHFNERSPDGASGSAVGQTKELNRLYNEQLDKIIKNGVNSGKDLKLLLKPPSDSVRTEGYKDHTPAQQKPPKIEIPDLNEKSLADLKGHLRMGNEAFALEGDGKGSCNVYRIHFENGKEIRDKEPCGKLSGKYMLELNGRPPVSLADEQRVLMDFTIKGDAREHHILGLGPGHYEANKGFRGGGLIEADQLLNEASQAHLQALKGNAKYFEERPYLNGWLGIGASDSSILGNREGILKDFEKNIARSEEQLKKEMDALFKKGTDGSVANGFDTSKTFNNNIDDSFKFTEMLMDNIGWSGKKSYDLALDGIQQQKLANDSIVMAATTVATAGVGSIISGLVNTGRLTAASGYAIEIIADAGIGGTLSVTGRASATSNDARNFWGGALEGSAMGFGSSFGRALGNLKQAQQIEGLVAKGIQNLNPEELALINSAVGKMVQAGMSPGTMKAIYYSARLGDSAVQTTAFTVSGAIREGDKHAWESVNATNIALGTLFMFGTQKFSEHMTAAPGKALEKSGLESALGMKPGTLANAMGMTEAGLATRALNDSTNAYTNAALGAIAQGYDMERERVAQELAAKLGVSADKVPPDMIAKNMSYSNIAQTVHEAGLQASITAPMLTLATAPVHHLAERGLGIKRDEQGRLIQPDKPHQKSTPSEHAGQEKKSAGPEQPLPPPKRSGESSSDASSESGGKQEKAAAVSAPEEPAAKSANKGDGQAEKAPATSEQKTDSAKTAADVKDMAGKHDVEGLTRAAQDTNNKYVADAAVKALIEEKPADLSQRLRQLAESDSTAAGAALEGMLRKGASPEDIKFVMSKLENGDVVKLWKDGKADGFKLLNELSSHDPQAATKMFQEAVEKLSSNPELKRQFLEKVANSGADVWEAATSGGDHLPVELKVEAVKELGRLKPANLEETLYKLRSHSDEAVKEAANQEINHFRETSGRRSASEVSPAGLLEGNKLENFLKAAEKALPPSEHEPEFKQLTARDRDLAKSSESLLEKISKLKHTDLPNLHDEQKIRELLKDKPKLLEQYEQLVPAIRERNALAEKLQPVIAARQEALQKEVNKLTEDLHLPQAKVVLEVSAREGERATYSPGEGVIRVRPEDLMVSENTRSLRSIVAHEATHLEQDSLLVRKYADELGIGQNPTPEQLKALRDLYQKHAQVNLNKDFAEQVLAERNGKPLDELQQSRAKLLEDSRKDHLDKQKLRDELQDKVDSLGHVNHALDSAEGVDAFMRELAADPAGTAKKYFGTAELPESVKRLAEGWDGAKQSDSTIDAARKAVREQMSLYEDRLLEWRKDVYIDQAELEAYQVSRKANLSEIRDNPGSTTEQKQAAELGLKLADRQFTSDVMGRALNRIDWESLASLPPAERDKHLTFQIKQSLTEQLGLKPGDRLPSSLENLEIKFGAYDRSQLAVTGTDAQGKPALTIQIPEKLLAAEGGMQDALSGIYRDLTRAAALDASNPHLDVETYKTQAEWTATVDSASRKQAEAAIDGLLKSRGRGGDQAYPEAVFMPGRDPALDDPAKTRLIPKDEIANLARRSRERESLQNGGRFEVIARDGSKIEIDSAPVKKFGVVPIRESGLPDSNPLIQKIAAEGKAVSIGGQPFVVSGENVYRARLVDDKGRVVGLYVPGAEIPPGRKIAVELQPHLKGVSGQAAEHDGSAATARLKAKSDTTGGEKQESDRTWQQQDRVKDAPSARRSEASDFKRDAVDHNKVTVDGKDYSIVHAEPGFLILNRPEDMGNAFVEPRNQPDRAKLRSFEMDGHKHYVDGRDGTVYYEIMRKDGPHLIPSASLKAQPLAGSTAEITFPNGQKLGAGSGEIEINRTLFKDAGSEQFGPNSDAVSRKTGGTIGHDQLGVYIRDDGKATNKIFVKAAGETEFRELKIGENYYIKPGDDVRIGQRAKMQALEISWPSTGKETDAGRFSVRDSDGRLTKVTDGSGNVLKEYEWKQLEGGAFVVTKVTGRDGSVWESKDGSTWTVRTGGGATRVEHAGIQLRENGDMIMHFADGSRRRENVDGTGSYRPGFMGSARLGYDQFGQTVSLTDANGVKYDIERSKSGKILKVTSSDGELIEWRKAKPDDPPGSEKYFASKDGKNPRELKGMDVHEGGVDIWEKNNHYTRRGIDGSLWESQADNSLRLVSVNARIEQTLLENTAISQIKSPNEQKRMVDAMRAFETTAAKLPPEQIGLVYHEINQLIRTEPSKLPLDQRLVIAEQLLLSAAKPFDINQGNNPVCTASVVAVRMMATNPSEAIRLVTEAVTNGYVTGRDGTVLYLDPSVIHADAGASTERHHRLGGYENTHQRSHADQILQNIVINYHWSQQGTNGPGGIFTPLGVRYARVANVSGPNDNGYRLIDISTGQPLKDKSGREVISPYINSSDLEGMMGLTGDKRPFVIINEKTTRREGKALVEGTDKKQLFNSEESMLAAIKDMKPSEKNPIVITVTTQTEPFYTDSGAGRAGGSGGQHVVSIMGVETRQERGPDGKMHDVHYVKIDNQWGQGAEHLQKPIKLHDLFVASHIGDDSQLIGQLRADLKQAKQAGQVDPNLELSLLRAQHSRWERADKYPSSMQNTMVALEIELSPAAYRNELQRLLARMDAQDPLYRAISPEQLANARKTAEETLKKIDGQVRNAAQGQAAVPHEQLKSDRSNPAEKPEHMVHWRDPSEEQNKNMQRWFEHEKKNIKLDAQEEKAINRLLEEGQLKYTLLDREFLRSHVMGAHEESRRASSYNLIGSAENYDPMYPSNKPVFVVFEEAKNRYHVMNGNNRTYLFGDHATNPDNLSFPVWLFNSPKAFEDAFGIDITSQQSYPFHFDDSK